MGNNGIVNIHGKEYMTVARRVELWLEDNKTNNEGYSIETEVIGNAIDYVVVKATVKFKGRTFTGISAVDLASTKTIEKSNPYEVAETSAVGRALGFAGYGIIEGIASADEMVKSAITSQPEAAKQYERVPVNADCAHETTEKRESHSEKNNGRWYEKCTNCNEFLGWTTVDSSD